ncbi:hypothetical protein A8C75_11840 [Marinobacterium aestuarii]|uniref:Thioredoxin-like fold domain-containing protein n=1 Tax=Marinobacterium aestuarii TaxID=1821621 RepID=A0A1A9EY76_9GAMM|nr:hypothetical protein [Marinobacterium aestuarii]ANG63094.1 hypothetical protein A8C75_11840 [Marinobacterium aestuarii]
MRVQLLVTKTDFTVANIEREFRDLGIGYQVNYLEDHPELVSRHNLRHSPNILIDGELAFQHQPTETELKAYFQQLKQRH